MTIGASGDIGGHGVAEVEPSGRCRTQPQRPAAIRSGEPGVGGEPGRGVIGPTAGTRSRPGPARIGRSTAGPTRPGTPDTAREHPPPRPSAPWSPARRGAPAGGRRRRPPRWPPLRRYRDNAARTRRRARRRTTGWSATPAPPCSRGTTDNRSRWFPIGSSTCRTPRLAQRVSRQDRLSGRFRSIAPSTPAAPAASAVL